MADFVIVVATIASLSVSPAVPGYPGTSAERQPIGTFQVYPSLESCRQEAALRHAPPGRRLICLPIEPLRGLANAY